MRWVRRRDPAGRVPALPNQLPGLVEACGLTRADVDRAAWAIDLRGNRWAAAAAVNRVLTELGGGWALLALSYRLAPVAWLEEKVYAWVARNRGRFSRLGIAPECEEPGVDCGEAEP